MPRPRLVRLLERGTALAATLVCAPRGFGKTTLLRQWSESTETPVARLRLGPPDGDAIAVTLRIAEALASVAPRLGRSAAELARRGGAASPRELGQALVQDLEQLDGTVVLILEDYQRADGAGLHDLLDELLRDPPLGLHLTIVTRHDPPLALQRLVASGSIQPIRAADLAFTRDETADLLRLLLGRELSDDALDAVMRSLGGWPAGLRLLALALAEPARDAELLERLPRSVHEARAVLSKEIIESRSEPTQRALALCTLVERFDAGLCEALLESDPESDGLSAQQFLERSRPFVVPDRERRGWYRVSGLFRDTLEERAAALDPQLARAAHDRAAAWFSDRGHLVEAAEHAARGSDPWTVADVIARHRIAYLNEQRLGELRHALELVPADTINDRLETCVLQVWLAQFDRIESAIERVEQVMARPSTPQAERDAVRGELHLMRLTRFACRGLELPDDLPDHVRHGRRALERLPGTFSMGRATAAFMLSGALTWSGEIEEARAVLERALGEHATLGGEALCVVNYALALLRFETGDLSGAREAAELCLRGDLDEERESPAASLARSLLSSIYYQWNELGEAERLLAEGAAGGEPSAPQCLSLALVRQAQGRDAEAARLVEKAIAVSTRHQDSANLSVAHAREAQLALTQGREEVALRWAAAPSNANRQSIHTALACACIRAGILARVGPSQNRERAREILAKVEALAQRSRRTRLLVRARAIQALLDAADGDEDSALAALGDALRRSETGGFVRTYLDLGPRMQSLLARLDVPGQRTSYVHRIREEFAKEPTRASASTASALPDPLTDRELDVLSLLAQRLSNKEIAARLFVSVATVKTHASTVYQKLHVKGRREAVEKAVALGMVQGGRAAP